MSNVIFLHTHTHTLKVNNSCDSCCQYFARFEYASMANMYATLDRAVNFLISFLLISVAIAADSVSNRAKKSIRSVDVEKTRIWGPGLEPHKIVLPVRYFYIQASDAYGNP